jgi:hypothetical protein
MFFFLNDNNILLLLFIFGNFINYRYLELKSYATVVFECQRIRRKIIALTEAL